MFSASYQAPQEHVTLVNAWIRLLVDYLSLNLGGFVLHYYLVIAGHLHTLMAVSEHDGHPLSKADEIAPRAYIREVFCFEFNGTENEREQAIQRIRKSMDAVAEKWPHLAGSISQDQKNPKQGSILLRQTSEDIRKFREEGLVAVRNIDKKIFPWSYQDLRREGFPLHSAANGNVFSQHPPLPDGSKSAPVFAVQLSFIDGGLIMSIYLHHSIGDGNCMGTLINSLAKATFNSCLGPEMNPPTLRTSVFEESVKDEFEEDWEQLLAECPEYTNLPKPSGPFQPDLSLVKNDPSDPPTGKIVSLPTERIQRLKCLCNRYLKDKYGEESFVSANDCIGALLWAHTINVRAKYLKDLNQPDKQAPITIPVDYRRKLRPALPDDYFGNAVALARASVPVSQLKKACLAHYNDAHSVGPLAETAHEFRKALYAVDDTYVRKRLALAHKIYDIRHLGLSANVEQDVTYNTWAGFGGDTVWKIPGAVQHPTTNGSNSANGTAADTCHGVKAEAIRRGHYEFNLVGHLTLPRRADSPVYEIIFQLRSSQMADILKDERFTRWIDRVIG